MLSDIGRVRRSNQDSAAMLPENGAFVVCDGMGGAAGGEVASRLAAEVFLDQLSRSSPRMHGDERGIATARERLRSATLAANRTVHQHALKNPSLTGMGTTLVGLLHAPVLGQERQDVAPPPGRSRRLGPPDLFVVNVGDSRCYRLRAGKLRQLSTDHSFVEEQVRAGQITEEQALVSPMRNYITRAVGPSSVLEPDVDSFRSAPGDVYLLCSDGLTRELSSVEIGDLLSATLGEGAPTVAGLRRAAQALVDSANLLGGRDNCTVLLLAMVPMPTVAVPAA